MTNMSTEHPNRVTRRISLWALACAFMAVSVVMSFQALAGTILSGNQHGMADGDDAVIAGGESNRTQHDYGFIGAGFSNFIGNDPGGHIQGEGGVIVGGTNHEVHHSWGTVGGGYNNTTAGQYSFIGGGKDNKTGENEDNSSCTVSGGLDNWALGVEVTVGGGAHNRATSNHATIGGGAHNHATSNHATIGGGAHNHATSNHTTIGGGSENEATALHGTIGGGLKNKVAGKESTISGGSNNDTTHDLTTIGGGFDNLASGKGTTVGGGLENKAIGNSITIGGGSHNEAAGKHATIGGGLENETGGDNATVGGGLDNKATGENATIGGGEHNEAAGKHATIAGGSSNKAAGDYSFAAGRRARATHRGSFVWADAGPDVVIGQQGGTSTPGLGKTGGLGNAGFVNFESSDENQFCVRARGGVRFASNAQGNVGVILHPGAGDWDRLSDRNAKTNIVPVDRQRILDALAQIPISTWHYKSQNGNVKHIGPMAQDFHAAFGVGTDERYIGTIDADGVALAAIQALHENQRQTIQDLTNRLETDRQQNEKLAARIEKLEAMIRSMQQDR